MMTMRTMVAALVTLLGAAVGCAPVDGESPAASVSEQRISCQYVKCAWPVCAPGQHLVVNEGQCCPVCRGPTRDDRCAAVLCAAVTCGEGEALVRRGNDCCGRCERVREAPECRSDLDCPQIYCIACPCPVSTCEGRRCVTRTPDASTCGAP